MKNDFYPLFRNQSLDGWHIVPRGIRTLEKGSPAYQAALEHKGLWSIQDGVVEGRQDPPAADTAPIWSATEPSATLS